MLLSSSIPLFPGEPRKNDALFLYGACAPKPFVYCYEQEAVEVVYGPSCKIEQEILTDRCSADRVPLVARRGGGGTVVLAPGMVVIIVVGERGRQGKPGDAGGESGGRHGSEIHAIFDRIHRGVVTVLSGLVEKPIEKEGISDLAIGKRKILGGSLYLGSKPCLYYYQSSLLVDADICLMSRYLSQPPREPAYRRGRGHGEFCTTLKREGHKISAGEVAKVLNEDLKPAANGE